MKPSSVKFKNTVSTKYVLAGKSTFTQIVTKVADAAGFHDKKKSYWECTNFSQAVAYLAVSLDIDVEVWSAEVFYQQDNGETKKGEKVSHTFLKIENSYYDFTASQFDSSLKYPFVFKTIPDSYLAPKKIRTATILDDGSEFWYKKLWKAYDH